MVHGTTAARDQREGIEESPAPESSGSCESPPPDRPGSPAPIRARSVSNMNAWTDMPAAAQALDVSEAYLSGCAQTLPVYDYATGGTHMSEIMREESIPTYGTLYLCDVPDVGPVSVILAGGVQLTLSDWQGAQVMTAAQIADPPNGRWVDGRGEDAIMLGGLPRVLR